jgi:hypothetical protein
MLWEKGFEEPNNGVREKELSCSPGCGAGKFHWYPLFLSVLRNSTDFAPCPRVEMYRLTSTLCQPLSLSYSGCPCIPSRIKYWWSFDHCFARLLWTWRRSSILEITSFCEQKLVLLSGARFFLFYWAKWQADVDRSDANEETVHWCQKGCLNDVEFPIQET